MTVDEYQSKIKPTTTNQINVQQKKEVFFRFRTPEAKSSRYKPKKKKISEKLNYNPQEKLNGKYELK